MREGERGLALVSVLWCLALLSLIAAAMLSSSLWSARGSHNAWARLQADMALDAGIHRAIAALEQGEDGWPVDGTSRVFLFDHFRIQISIQDQAGLINLNTAAAPQLRALFEGRGVSPDQAGALVDHLLDWRSPPGAQRLNGAALGSYRAAGYLPRNGPFRSVDELNLVQGISPSLFSSLAPLVTVYGQSSGTDTRTAPLSVLETLPGMDSAMAAGAVAMRGKLSPAKASPGSTFAIQTQIRVGRQAYARDAVVEITADPNRPFLVLSWR